MERETQMEREEEREREDTERDGEKGRGTERNGEREWVAVSCGGKGQPYASVTAHVQSLRC